MNKSIIPALLATPIAAFTIAATQTLHVHADTTPATASSAANPPATANSGSASSTNKATNESISTTNSNQNTSASQTTQQNSATSSNSNPATPQKPASRPTPKPIHHYQRVIKTKTVNYDTIIKKTSNLYHGGAYNTKTTNVKNNGTSASLKKKWVHVTSLQTTKTGTYAHIFHSGKDRGWINQTAFDNTAFKLNNVPLIKQRPELPTGCEITAVTMMVNYATKKRYRKTYLANKMPRSSNPNKGFVGSPYSKSGWYIYPLALMKLVKHYIGSSINLTGKSTAAILKYVKQHQHPVVIYVADVDGFPNHALTVTGFAGNRIFYNDPWLGRRTSMKISTMSYHRSRDANRAISY